MSSTPLGIAIFLLSVGPAATARIQLANEHILLQLSSACLRENPSAFVPQRCRILVCSGMSSWQPPVSSANGSTAAAALRAAVSRITHPHERLLVIVGAHHFGADANDPIHSIVGKVPWGGALLIEASPVIARELSQSIATLNPLPRVPSKRVIVSNVGIRDDELPPEPGRRPFHRTFYTMTAHGGGLPGWSTQIGSFNREQVTNVVLKKLHPQQLARGGNWTAQQLSESILADVVLSRTLAQELRAHAALRALRPAVLLVDTEGLDCRIVAAQDWCRPPLDELALLVWEHKHCKVAEYTRARAALGRCPQYSSAAGASTFADRANVFYLMGGARSRPHTRR